MPMAIVNASGGGQESNAPILFLFFFKFLRSEPGGQEEMVKIVAKTTNKNQVQHR